ncbi:MAG: polysaccharide biosynthesis/export family protein [Gemmatimonadaceae bacterium]
MRLMDCAALALVASLIAALDPSLANGCVGAQSPPQRPMAASDTLHALRPGDIVRLRIWREPDLSGDYPVDETGSVVLPKLGPYKVTADSPASLKQKLVGAYQAYLQNPSIEVTLLRRITVLGAVQKPGLYPVDPTMTVADALALAGGPTPDGSPDKVELIRDGERITARLNGRTLISDSPIRSGDQLRVPQRGWFIRNIGLLSLALSTGVTLIYALGR